MKRRFHPGTFIAGVIFAGLGTAFLFENLGYWEFHLRDLRLIGPLVVILIGVAVVVGGMRRRAEP
jgi:hypothetical protein